MCFTKKKFGCMRRSCPPVVLPRRRADVVRYGAGRDHTVVLGRKYTTRFEEKENLSDERKKELLNSPSASPRDKDGPIKLLLDSVPSKSKTAASGNPVDRSPPLGQRPPSPSAGEPSPQSSKEELDDSSSSSKEEAKPTKDYYSVLIQVRTVLTVFLM